MKRLVLPALAFVHGVPAMAPAAPELWDETAAKSHCEGQWRGDFAMQAYCIDQNRDGFENYFDVFQRNPELTEAFEKCERDWTIQWNMVNYCANQQIEKRKKLPAILEGIPQGASDQITRKCQEEWYPDYAMIAYCAGQQADGWRQVNG